jgi:hypothetical protein
MKTLFNHNQQSQSLAQCELSEKSLLEQPSFLRWLSKLRGSILKRMSRHVHLVTRDFLAAYLKSLIKSRGFYAGLALVTIGLLSKHLYQVFDPAVRGQIGLLSKCILVLMDYSRADERYFLRDRNFPAVPG